MNHYFTNNDNLHSELRTLGYQFADNKFLFKSDLGIFAKDKIDLGSKMLAESYFKYGKKNVSILDVGCGYGFLGITLSKIMDCEVDMIDINLRAIHLTKMNIKDNQANAIVFESNVYDKVTKKYDVIISNPPIKAGKNVYGKIINDSFEYLNESGELWFVMRTNHGVKTLYKKLSLIHETKIIMKNNGFYVIYVKKALTS